MNAVQCPTMRAVMNAVHAHHDAAHCSRVVAMHDPIVRALGRARGGGNGDEANGDEAEIEAGSDEDVPGGADPIVRALGRARDSRAKA